jgi:hypothetical protein
MVGVVESHEAWHWALESAEAAGGHRASLWASELVYPPKQTFTFVVAPLVILRLREAVPTVGFDTV